MTIPRIAITLDERGDIVSICADQPVEVYTVSPHTPGDRVYLMSEVDIGPQHIRAAIGGYAIGHNRDGTLSDGGPVSPRLPPIKPALSVVGDEA